MTRGLSIFRLGTLLLFLALCGGGRAATTSPVDESSSGDADAETCPIASSLRDSVKSCRNAKCLVDALRTSLDFIDSYWEQRPLLLHIPPSALGKAKLEWDDLVDVAEGGLLWAGGGGGPGGPGGGPGGPGGGGGFNNLVRPSSPPNGEENDVRRRFAGRPMGRLSMESGLLAGNELIMGAVQTLHLGVAKLVLDFQNGLGLSMNGDVRASGPNVEPSPILTDRKDLFVIQTCGKKRWKVYQPKEEAMYPVWGVHGNGEWGRGDRDVPPGIPPFLLGKHLIDTVLEPGDVLYVPRGFPHSLSSADVDDVDGEEERSVSVVLAAHTEAHHYVYEKVLRCALAKSGFCEEEITVPPPPPGRGPPPGQKEQKERHCPIGLELTRLVRSKEGEDLRRGLPLGFLNGDEGWFAYAKPLADTCQKGLMKLKKAAEAKKLDHGGDFDKALNENLPDVAKRTFEYIGRDLVELKKTFASGSVNKEWPYEKRQELWHRTFSMIGPFQGEYCHEDGPRAFFRDYFSPELEPDEFTRRLVMSSRRGGPMGAFVQ